MTAVGCCGLQLYNFGATISIPFWDESGAPDSFYDKLLGNFASGLHTLCLLDIRVKEKSLENILRQRNVYEPSRFMSCEIAAQQLLEIADKRQASSGDICPALAPDCLAVGLARVGSATQMIVVTSLKEMSRTCDDERKTCDSASVAMTLGGPLHSMIIPGFIQPIEEEFLLSRYLHPESSSQNLPIVAIPSHSNLSNQLTDLRQLFAVHNRLVLGAKNGIKHSTKSYMHTLRSFFIAYLHELRPSLFFQALYVPAIVVVHLCFYVCPLLRLETSGDRPRLRMNYGSLSPLMLSIVGPEV
ncbi:unnamed protein product [Dicrocoelium dendriticum]|nr:unnamed protein product [Dicrocoelium dendriticum]